MSGGRIIASQFDPTKKSGWFWSDINGFIYTTILVCFGLFIIAGGCYMLITSLTPQALALVLLGVGALIAFVIVFCFRQNIALVGEPRQFRYLFRWL